MHVGVKRRFALKKGDGLALKRWYPFETKLNARGREKKIC